MLLLLNFDQFILCLGTFNANGRKPHSSISSWLFNDSNDLPSFYVLGSVAYASIFLYIWLSADLSYHFIIIIIIVIDVEGDGVIISEYTFLYSFTV